MCYGTIHFVAAFKNGISETALYLGQLCQPFIRRAQSTDQLRSGLWLIEADGHCGQMSVEYDLVRLAAMGI